MGVAEIDLDAVEELISGAGSEPHTVALGNTRSPEHRIRDGALVVRRAEPEDPAPKGRPAAADRVPEAVAPSFRLDDLWLLRIVELEDELVEPVPVRPRDVGEQRELARQLVEGAQRDALGEIGAGVGAGVGERAV